MAEPQTPKGEEGGNPKKETPESLPEGTGQEGQPEETPGSDNLPVSDPEKEELKQKFSASSKEALRLLEENKNLKAKLESNFSSEPPSDDEASRVVPDWDLLSPSEQNLHKEQIMLKRQMARMGVALSQTHREVNWDKQFTDLAKIPIFSVLKDKKSEFQEFCNGKEPDDILARAFLFEQAKELGAKEERERKARPGLESSSGGERKPAPKGLSAEERAKLRINDPVKYQKLIREGKI